MLILSACACAWDDCPLGLVNDTYPGNCVRYVDTTKTGLCDHSQTRPTTTLQSQTTVTPAAGPAATTTPLSGAQKPATGEYYFIPITASLLVIYVVSDCMSRKNILFGCDAATGSCGTSLSSSRSSARR